MSEIPNTKIENYITESPKPKLVFSGSDFFSQLELLINQAQRWIHLQFYIFQSDQSGMRIASLLEKAVERGVQVYLVVDGIGSPRPSNPMFKNLRQNGVHVKHFEPLNIFKEGYLSRRLHNKIAVTDRMDFLIGGINIADRYNDIDHEPAWLDLAVFVNHPIALKIKFFCEQIWKEETELAMNETSDKIGAIRFLRNDWRKHLNEISISHLDLFKNTKQEMIVLCSYFLPGKALRRSIKFASSRNVSTILITTKTSDVPISKHAERWLYDWLFRNKVRIYEFQKNVLHAKLILSDASCVNMGSYNINNLSAYGSIECNLEIRDIEFGNMVHKYLSQLVKDDCIEITKPKNGRKYKLFYQFTCWFSYHLLEGILYISTNGFQRKSMKPKIRLK
jgi:cardiolipin synthase